MLSLLVASMCVCRSMKFVVGHRVGRVLSFFSIIVGIGTLPTPLSPASVPLPKMLKVPKREIFVTELFILSDLIWEGDLRTEPKKPFV
jgi:hypothetical protein